MDIAVFESFESCEKLWRSFESSVPHHVFQSFDWLSTWQKTIGEQQRTRVFIVVLSDRHEVKMILPFGVRPHKKIFKTLCWLGAGTCDYMGPLWDQEFFHSVISWPKIWQDVLSSLKTKARFDQIRFDNMPALWDGGKNPMMAVEGLKAKNEYSFAALEQVSFEDFYLLRSKNLRQDSKRQRERLIKEGGSLSFEIATDKKEGLNWLEILFAQKSRRYNEMGVKDLFSIKSFRDFYEGIFLLKKDWVHLSSLSCGNEKVALHLGAFYRERFYYLLPAYAPAPWAKFSPGRILLEELIKWTFEQKGSVFDFTLGAEAYKKDWCSHTEQLFQRKAAASMWGRLL